jgi:hypothetical protein
MEVDVSVPTMAVINFSKQLSDQDVQAGVRAVNRQVAEDFMPIWGYGRTLKLVQPRFNPSDMNTLAEEQVNADSVIYIVDENLLPGALGFHDLNAADLPFGFVFVLDPNDWTVTLSHEVLELILDPTVNLFVPGPDPRDAQNIVLHSYEACDAVERTSYMIDGIAVSNFLTPSYFTIGEAPGARNDFLGVNVKSFGVTQGSHIAFFDLATGQFETVFGRLDFSSRATSQRRFTVHDKAKRPPEDKLRQVLAQFYATKPRRAKIAGITRTGRYMERLAGDRARPARSN